MALASIASLLAGLDPAPEQVPWPRYAVAAHVWSALGEALGAGEGDLLALWAEPDRVHLALRSAGLPLPVVATLAVDDGTFPSIGRHHPPALRLERAVRDLTGLEPVGHPDMRPWLDHGAFGIRAPVGVHEPAPIRDPANYAFLPVHGEGLHQIPVGPVHAGIIEPGHFRFTANGETVARLEERLGYVHKGIDSLLIDAPLERAQRIVARVSGDATVALSFAFVRAVEAACGAAAPPRAQVLRGVMAEFERIANHLGDVGAICNDAAFVLIHAHAGILRERILQACDTAFGHRLMMDRLVPGGITVDLTDAHARLLVDAVEEVKRAFVHVVRVYDQTPSLQDRTCGTGRVSADLVRRWAAGGYVGRASGRAFDARRDLAYPPYDAVTLDVPVLTTGDVDARVWIRIREIEASIALVRRWLAALPGGPVYAPFAVRDREGIAMTEAFRGDVLAWVRLAAGRVARCHVRDPSSFQWPLLEAAIEGNIVADFPLCNKSFNCSYSGHDL